MLKSNFNDLSFLLKTLRSDESSSRIQELEEKLATLKAKAQELGVVPTTKYTKYTEALSNTAVTYRPKTYDPTNYKDTSNNR